MLSPGRTIASRRKASRQNCGWLGEAALDVVDYQVE
jgi:hypothetical protein